jgi:hypothetical protein
VKNALADKLRTALDEVSIAHDELAELLRKIRVAPRAEKTTVSTTVQDALKRLGLARNSLFSLQELIATDDDLVSDGEDDEDDGDDEDEDDDEDDEDEDDEEESETDDEK